MHDETTVLNATKEVTRLRGSGIYASDEAIARAVLDSLPKGMEPPADLVEACLAAYWQDMRPCEQCREGQECGMTAALRRCVNDPRVLGDPTSKEWGESAYEDRSEARIDQDGKAHLSALAVKRMLRRRCDALFAPTVKLWSERYLAGKCNGDWWCVYLDGVYVDYTKTQSEEIAEATRIGLIAQKEQEKAQ